MENEVIRASIVRRLVGAALDLYIRDADPFSVYALTNTAAEHAAELARQCREETFSQIAAAVHPQLGLKGVQRLRNKYWTPIKHPRDQKGSKPYNLKDCLEGFSDSDNRHNLLIVWHDYTVSGYPMPIEAQVFWAWYMLIEPECFEPEYVRGAEAEFSQLLVNFKDRKSKELFRAMIQKIKVAWQFQICQNIDMRPLLLENSDNLLNSILRGK